MSTGPDHSNAGCLELLHDPEIVLLDEPTIGLDVVAKERIRGFVRERNRERGSTVVLTTHDMSDVERLCERVVVIDHGRLLFDGDLELMRRRFGAETVLVVDLEEPGPPLALPGTRVARVEGPRQWLHFGGSRSRRRGWWPRWPPAPGSGTWRCRSRRSRTWCGASTWRGPGGETERADTTVSRTEPVCRASFARPPIRLPGFVTAEYPM